MGRKSCDREGCQRKDAGEVHALRAKLGAEQRTIALYWADNSGESGRPAAHWISIASQMVSQRGLSAVESARLMVVTAVAQADAFTASWGYKYELSTIRPRPFIRRTIDSTWERLIPNPQFPSTRRGLPLNRPPPPRPSRRWSVRWPSTTARACRSATLAGGSWAAASGRRS